MGNKNLKITERIKKERLFFDGGTGTVLERLGLLPIEPSYVMNSRNALAVRDLHLSYLRAGADIIKTNTFGINSLKCDNVEREISLAIGIAKDAVGAFAKDAYIALDVGPTGRMLKPFGDLDFEEAIEIFAINMRLAEKYGADLILIETMGDLYETKAAVIAAKENSSLPVFVTCAFGVDGKLLTGASPSAVVSMLEGLGVDAIGMNCSVGPEHMLKLLPEFLECASVPVILNPNAGLPKMENGESVYDLGPDEFAAIMARGCEMGATVVGGCCGTTPEYIKKLCEASCDIPVSIPAKKKTTMVSSYTHAVEIGGVSKIVGERINPTGKPRLKEALRSSDISHILSIAISEQEHGAHILDVNVGLADIDEVDMMSLVISEIQSVCDLPISIDTGNTEAMERAMRIYCGKPLLNSVNGSAQSMESVFPLVKKYGAAVIALTMDEDGIPQSAAERVKIADRIVSEAGKYGIDESDIIFDPLTLSVASGADNALITLESVRILKSKGYKCALGVSNVSFGLPMRDSLNASFYTAALFAGLDIAIINPESEEMMRAYRSYRALSLNDEGCKEYINYCNNLKSDEKIGNEVEIKHTSLGEAVRKGLKKDAYAITEELVKNTDPFDIINREIIPALDEIGRGFEEKRIYLPELLMSAEAANSAFSVIRERIPASSVSQKKKITLASVKGDIHDIGKNIVRLIFESYGYDVTDLGRDVSKETVLSALRDNGAEILGLSALMTTTLPAMEETVALVKKELPHVKIIVGGAVVTATYANKIGADFYAKDAMSGLRYAEGLGNAKSQALTELK